MTKLLVLTIMILAPASLTSYVLKILFIRNKSRAKLGISKSFHADEVRNIFALPHRKGDIYREGVIEELPTTM